MKKKLVLAVSALVFSGWAVGAFAAKTGVSPFDDHLTILMNGFPSDMMFQATYVPNNGVNINGPEDFNADAPSVVRVFSNNKVEDGYPVMKIRYPTLSGSGHCTLNLADGPWRGLDYRSGSAPVCAGIALSPVSPTEYGYTVTITDNEP